MSDLNQEEEYKSVSATRKLTELEYQVFQKVKSNTNFSNTEILEQAIYLLGMEVEGEETHVIPSRILMQFRNIVRKQRDLSRLISELTSMLGLSIEEDEKPLPFYKRWFHRN